MIFARHRKLVDLDELRNRAFFHGAMLVLSPSNREVLRLLPWRESRLATRLGPPALSSQPFRAEPPSHHLLPLPRLLSRYDGLPTSWLLTLTLALNLLEDLPLTALIITHLALRRGHPHTISVVALGFSLIALWCDALTPRLVTP